MKSFFNIFLANPQDNHEQKILKIQKDHIYTLSLDNGLTKNIKIIDKKNIHENKLQVINQYVSDQGKHENRYDVTILVNGIPLIHIELKKRGIALKEAFNQINRYKNESFYHQVVYSIIFKFLSFRTELIQSIIPTQLDICTLKI